MPFELPAEIASTIPTDIANHISVQRYNSIADLMKGHVELQDYRGRSIALPDKPEDWEKWTGETSAKLKDHGYGISKLSDLPPDSPDKYEFKFDGTTPEQLKNDALLAKFRPIAHELGITNKQAQGLIERFANDLLPEMMEPPVERIEGDAAMKLIEDTFKGETRQRLDTYRAFINAMKADYPDLEDLIHDSKGPIQGKEISFFDHPTIIKIFSDMAEKFKQDFGGNLKGGQPEGAADAKREIDDIRLNTNNPKHALWKKGDRATLDYVDSLWMKVTGGK